MTYIQGTRIANWRVGMHSTYIGDDFGWRCECVKCGYKKNIRHFHLISGTQKPCRCMRKKESRAKIKAKNKPRISKKSGVFRIRSIYHGMINRCKNPENNSYKYYGGRGIKICSAWEKSFESFKEWAIKNGYSDSLTIERVNVNGNYEPDNCTWIPLVDQAKNTRRTVKYEILGQTVPLSELLKITGISYSIEKKWRGVSREYAQGKLERRVKEVIEATVTANRKYKHSKKVQIYIGKNLYQ